MSVAFGDSQEGNPMIKLHFFRCVSILVLACLLPSVLSCSGQKGADPAKGTDKDTPNGIELPQSNKAIDEATEAIARDPNGVNERSESPYARRGRVYAGQGEYDKAIADYTEAVRVYQTVKPPYLRPRLVEVYQLRAECHQKKKEYDKAITDYGEVIQLGTGVFSDLGEAMVFGGFAAGAHYKRGICYDDTGDHAKALADYKEAVRLNPHLAKNEDLKERMGK
jgi:tetratricopeptide (TPR) repeat protein